MRVTRLGNIDLSVEQLRRHLEWREKYDHLDRDIPPGAGCMSCVVTADPAQDPLCPGCLHIETLCVGSCPECGESKAHYDHPCCETVNETWADSGGMIWLHSPECTSLYGEDHRAEHFRCDESEPFGCKAVK